ncbi:MAG: type II toxin-antitoxin system HicB family antitoxin [Bacteroidales bacterium]|nr:type II toxin-antitoxin system HicB family antitoxin [Bacteroidales bacterium]
MFTLKKSNIFIIKLEAKIEYNFKIIIEECEEGGYFAECPAFQGCHTEGITFEETLNEMKLLIKEFIEDYKKNNEEIPSDNYSVASLKIAI